MSFSVGKTSSSSTGCVHRPGLMPGPEKIKGTRVPSSQSVFFPVISFSPMCQPWSDHKTTMVFFVRSFFYKESNNRPI